MYVEYVLPLSSLTIDSYLEQRNSFSRLTATERDIQRLLYARGVFPRFEDFLVSFSVRFREFEIGPPLMRMRFFNRGFGKYRYLAVDVLQG